jgi:hypothetical protein
VNNWTLSGAEFAVLWGAMDRETLPGSIGYRTHSATAEQYRAELERASAAVAAKLSDNLYSALVALALSEARLSVYGGIGPKLERPIRIHAAIRQRVGVLLVQSDDDSVAVRRVGADRVPGLLTEALPRLGPGRGRRLRARLTELRPRTDEEYLRDVSYLREVGSTRPSQAQLVRRFMARERMCRGSIEIQPGPALDNRPIEGTIMLSFMDYADDGRYLVRTEDDVITIEPVDQVALAEHIRLAVGSVRKLYLDLEH